MIIIYSQCLCGEVARGYDEVKKLVMVMLILSITLLAGCAYGAPHIMAKAGTEVLVKNIDKLNSKHLKEGQVIQFLAEKSIKDKNGNVIIEQGAMAYGTVSQVSSAGMAGSAGKLGIKFNSIKAFNDMDIPLSGSNDANGSGNVGAVVATALLIPIIFIPAAFLFRGSNAVIQSGTIFRAYVAKDTLLVPGDEEAAAEAEKAEYAKNKGFSGGNSETDDKLNDILKGYENKEKNIVE